LHKDSCKNGHSFSEWYDCGLCLLLRTDKLGHLFVGDSEAMRRMIRRFIKDQTDEVAECDDGSEALENYKKHNPDFVLMDLTRTSTALLPPER
jgi:hypothetical protein